MSEQMPEQLTLGQRGELNRLADAAIGDSPDDWWTAEELADHLTGDGEPTLGMKFMAAAGPMTMKAALAVLEAALAVLEAAEARAAKAEAAVEVLEHGDRASWELLVAQAEESATIYEWKLGAASPTLLGLSRYLDWTLWSMKLADDLTTTLSQLDIVTLRDRVAALEAAEARLAKAEGAAEKLAEQYSSVRDWLYELGAMPCDRCPAQQPVEGDLTCQQCATDWAYAGEPPVPEDTRLLDALETEVFSLCRLHGDVWTGTSQDDDGSDLGTYPSVRELLRAAVLKQQQAAKAEGGERDG